MKSEKEQRTANKGFASGGVTCKPGVKCFYITLVIISAFVLRFPARMQSREPLAAIQTEHLQRHIIITAIKLKSLPYIKTFFLY